MNKEKALKNQGLEFREDIWVVRGDYSGSILSVMHREPWSPTDE